MVKTAVLVLCVAVAASASPQFFGRRRSEATGGANANVISGSSSGPLQGSRITQVSASAGGTARGNAASNNFASATNLGTSGIFGSTDFSNTQAVSNQRTFDRGFGTVLRRPNRPFRRFNRNRFF